MKQTLISADGGGTKTEFCVHDMATGSDKFFTYGSTNFKTVGVEAAKRNLVHAFAEICKKEGIAIPNIRGMVLGLSGYDSKKDMRVFNDMAATLGVPPDKMLLYNDCELAFRAAATPPGICTVAGTGSIAFGLDENGTATRCGGWGGLLSDSGSGYWIAGKVLRRLLLYCDGMDDYQPVFDVLKKFYGCTDMRDMPFVLTELNITDIAASAKPIMDFARGGDAYCRAVVGQAAQLVAQITLALSRRIGFRDCSKASFVVTGSLYRDEAFYSQYLACLADAFQAEPHLIHIGERTSQNGIRLAIRLFGNE